MKEKEVYRLVESFPDKIKKAYSLDIPKLSKKFKKIAFIGMGGNYIAGCLLRQFLRDEIGVEIFTRPSRLFDSQTLIILSSYSGNTKEVLEVFRKAKKVNILVLTSGGKLLREAEKNKVKIIKVPFGIHQRFTFAECFLPIIRTLENSELIKKKKMIIENIIKNLTKNRKKIEEDAEKLAKKLKNKIPLFYASQYFYAVAYRLQTAIEEDIKIICHANKITELFHNEIEALPDKRFFPVLLIDKDETKEFNRQLKFFKKYIKGYYEIDCYSSTREQRMFLIFYFADFLCYYLAKLKNKEMGQTPISDKIKKL